MTDRAGAYGPCSSPTCLLLCDCADRHIAGLELDNAKLEAEGLGLQESITVVGEQLKEAQEERDFWPLAYERMSAAYTQLSFWTRALNRQSDTAIGRAEAVQEGGGEEKP